MRQVCTKENPCNKDKGGQWSHPEAKLIDEVYDKSANHNDY